MFNYMLHKPKGLTGVFGRCRHQEWRSRSSSSGSTWMRSCCCVGGKKTAKDEEEEGGAWGRLEEATQPSSFLSEQSLCKITFSLISNCLFLMDEPSRKTLSLSVCRHIIFPQTVLSPLCGREEGCQWIQFNIKIKHQKVSTCGKSAPGQQLERKATLSGGGGSNWIRVFQTLTGTNKDLTDLRSELSDRLAHQLYKACKKSSTRTSFDLRV